MYTVNKLQLCYYFLVFYNLINSKVFGLFQTIEHKSNMFKLEGKQFTWMEANIFSLHSTLHRMISRYIDDYTEKIGKYTMMKKFLVHSSVENITFLMRGLLTTE